MYILNRPMEIMILVGLNAAVGVILLMNGLATGGVEFPSGLPSPSSGLPSMVEGIMSILGAFELPLAAAFLGSAAGLFLGKGWGWTMSRALQVIGIAFAFGFLYDAGGAIQTMGLYVIGMAINGVVVGFLYAPEVREFYGKTLVVHTKRQKRRKRQEAVAEEEEDEMTEAEDSEPSAAEVE